MESLSRFELYPWLSFGIDDGSLEIFVWDRLGLYWLWLYFWVSALCGGGLELGLLAHIDYGRLLGLVRIAE